MTPTGAGADAPPSSSARPRIRRIAAVVNTAAGGVGPGAAAMLERLVRDRGHELEIAAPPPHEIQTAIRSALETAPDLLIILAGDGTARLAAELAGPDGPLLAPLPGGTLNMLPHALYGPGAWPAALAAALDSGVERVVCGGRIGTRSFYVAAILGAPALWAHAREAVRAGHLVEAVRHASYALRRAFTGRLHYGLDDHKSRRTEALVLISPLVSRALAGQSALEAASLDVRSAREVFRLAVNGLAGDWRRDPGVTALPCQHGLARARRPIPCILDGELHRLPRRVAFEFVPRAFRALAPPVDDPA